MGEGREKEGLLIRNGGWAWRGRVVRMFGEDEPKHPPAKQASERLD